MIYPVSAHLGESGGVNADPRLRNCFSSLKQIFYCPMNDIFFAFFRKVICYPLVKCAYQVKLFKILTNVYIYKMSLIKQFDLNKCI